MVCSKSIYILVGPITNCPKSNCIWSFMYGQHLQQKQRKQINFCNPFVFPLTFGRLCRSHAILGKHTRFYNFSPKVESHVQYHTELDLKDLKLHCLRGHEAGKYCGETTLWLKSKKSYNCAQTCIKKPIFFSFEFFIDWLH